MFCFCPSGCFVSHWLRSEDHVAEAREKCQEGKSNLCNHLKGGTYHLWDLSKQTLAKMFAAMISKIRFGLDMSLNQLWEIITLWRLSSTSCIFFIFCNCFTQSIDELKPQVNDLSQSSNTVFNYVNGISNSLRERQRLSNGAKEICNITLKM